MSLVQPLIDEMEQEGATTRRLLQRLPAGQLGWKPHPKARSLGQLAMHIAGVQAVLAKKLQSSSADANDGPREVKPESVDEIVTKFDENLATAKSLLSNLDDANVLSTWSLLREGKPIFTMPKIAVIR